MRIPGRKHQGIQEIPAGKRPAAAGLRRIIQNLLHNRLARYYFESGITSAAYKSVKELLESPRQFLEIMLEIDMEFGIGGIDSVKNVNSLPNINKAKEAFVKRAAASISEFLITVKPTDDLKDELGALKQLFNEGKLELFITEFLKKSNGFYDLGKFIDVISYNLQYAEIKGDYQESIRHFLSLYFVLRSGHLISQNMPEKAASPAAISLPTVPSTITAAPEFIDSDIRRPLLSLIGYSKRNGTGRYGNHVKELLASPHHPDLKTAIEKAIHDYHKIRADGETEASFKTIIAELGKKDPEINATNYYEREETYNETVGRAQDILAVWKPGHDTRKLQRLIANVLVLIKYPE